MFGSDRDGAPGLYRRNADGTGDAERLYLDDEASDLIANAWSSAGDALVVVRRSRLPRNDLRLLTMGAEPATQPLLESEFNETRASVSADGHWIAYESNRSGLNEVYVEAFPELGDRQLISTDGGQQPRWSADGRVLFYLGPVASKLMVVPVTAGSAFEAGTPEVLVEGQFLDFLGRSSYDVASDGRVVIIRRGTVTEESGAVPPINVVLNWHSELLARVPVD